MSLAPRAQRSQQPGAAPQEGVHTKVPALTARFIPEPFRSIIAPCRNRSVKSSFTLSLGENLRSLPPCSRKLSEFPSVQFCSRHSGRLLTEENEGNKDSICTEASEKTFVAFVSFCLIRSVPSACSRKQLRIFALANRLALTVGLRHPSRGDSEIAEVAFLAKS